MKLMPFNFDKFEDDKYLVSNLAGFHEVISDEELIDLSTAGTVKCNETLARLQSGLFVSPSSSEQAVTAALASGFSKKLIQELSFKPIFMIVPTLRCDHSCSYCQVSRASIEAQGYDLDEAHIPTIIDIIKRLSSGPYKLEIQGGEPLVRFDLVQKIYAEAEKTLNVSNFEFVITTSLSLLSDEIIQWAKNKNVHFSTSLDGESYIHNENRIISSSNSYELATKWIERIIDQLGFDRVSTVTTVTRSLLNHPDSILKAHDRLGLHDIFVRPISPYGFAKKQKKLDYSINEYMSFYKKLFKEISDYNDQGVPFREYSATVHVSRILNPRYSSYADLKSPSGLLLNCILFNYDGQIYGSDEMRMLQRVIKGADFSMGSVDAPNILTSLTASLIDQSFNFVHPGCSDCAYQPFCGSDPCQNISAQGESVGNKSLSTFCKYHMEMFRFIFSKIYSDNQARSLLSRWSDA
ncbi:His-Xaa-Ser system radical SAM maturase HxsB [Gilvimarinus japonicus]|uniref:His-Xaa-Ser system radical SAM maturase HxsB n=1 Tax=Gilvimarinus japonicus TaxID=1796469 RepID=A0ABV7HNN8_9GAMM